MCSLKKAGKIRKNLPLPGTGQKGGNGRRFEGKEFDTQNGCPNALGKMKAGAGLRFLNHQTRP